MSNFNRRAWLKTSLGFATSIAAAPLIADRLMAAPMNAIEQSLFPGAFSSITVKLNANENPYVPSREARKAIADIVAQANRYPFQVIQHLKDVIARKEGLSRDHIAIGAGSAELLCATGAAFAKDGGNIIAPFPTFPLLMSYSEVFGSRWERVNLNADLEIDYATVAARVNADTRLVFICNPNNPTGTFVDPLLVRSFCEEVSRKVTVFADEAYIEFLEPGNQHSMVELVKKDLDIIVSKTFSKIYGLAGLRIGYIIARPDIVKKVSQYQAAFTVSQTAVAAAAAVYGDENFMASTRRRNSEARKILTDFLDQRQFTYAKSVTNFLFIDTGASSSTLAGKLADHGIGIRTWEYQDRIWNRISIGTKEEMRTLVDTMKLLV